MPSEKQKKATEKKLDKINGDIEDMEDEIEALEEEAEMYQQQLVDLLVTIQIINADIDTKNEEINQAQAEYDEALQKLMFAYNDCEQYEKTISLYYKITPEALFI